MTCIVMADIVMAYIVMAAKKFTEKDDANPTRYYSLRLIAVWVFIAYYIRGGHPPAASAGSCACIPSMVHTTCMCACECACARACVHVRVRVHACAHACEHACVHVRVRVRACSTLDASADERERRGLTSMMT